MGNPMLRFYSPLIFQGALLLLLALPGTLCAEEVAFEVKVVAKENPDLPVGYEEAAEPAKKKPEKEKSSKPQKPNEPKNEEADADLPIGYEDADKVGEQKKKKPQQQAVKQAGPKDAKTIAEEKKKIAANPRIQALIVQMRKRLAFAKTVCQPNPEQLKKMKAQATPAWEQILRTLAIQELDPQRRRGLRIFVKGRAMGHREPEDILNQFEEAVNQIVTEVFPPETVAIYQGEQRHRKEFHARAGAVALVAHLDTKFHLTAPQREALSDSLQEVWQRTWQRYLQTMAHNSQFFPPVPDEAGSSQTMEKYAAKHSRFPLAEPHWKPNFSSEHETRDRVV